LHAASGLERPHQTQPPTRGCNAPAHLILSPCWPFPYKPPKFQVEAKVKQANDAIFAAQKQAASVIDSKLAAIGLPGVAVNATQKLQAQVLAIGAAYQVRAPPACAGGLPAAC
jgi:hypothetical protein